VKREWQLLENQAKHDAEQKEKELAAAQAEESKKAKVDLSDSEEERLKLEMAGQSLFQSGSLIGRFLCITMCQLFCWLEMQIQPNIVVFLASLVSFFG